MSISKFKVKKIYETKIESIIVFYGATDIENIKDLFEEDPTNDAFTDIFMEYELDEIRRRKMNKDKIDVIFSKYQIHSDDNIRTIKLKICQTIKDDEDKISFSIDEQYLFYLKQVELNSTAIYQKITNNGSEILTKQKMDQLTCNLYDMNENYLDVDLPVKETYTFDDILSLNLMDTGYLVSSNLGNASIFSLDEPFIANPYRVSGYDLTAERRRRDGISQNSSLVLDSGQIYNNTIYLCTAEDVLTVKMDDNIEITTKIYYPLLYKSDIKSAEEIGENKSKLVDETGELLKDVIQSFAIIDMFYDMYSTKRPSDFFAEDTKNIGIKSFKLRIKPLFRFKIPIDIVFKLIHSTETSPLIKFNPDARFENIYRLYADKHTEDGKKIPLLNKATINGLIRDIGKSKSVAVYNIIKFNGINYEIICEFYDNGSIHVYSLSDFDKPILLDTGENSFQTINELIMVSVNPIIEQVKSFFEQSGLHMTLFNDILDDNIELLDMTFQIQYIIHNKIELTKYTGCISNILNIETYDFTKGADLRYKRVSNFNKRDSHSAFVIDKIHQSLKLKNIKKQDIIEEVTKNYTDVTEEQARELVDNILSELSNIRGINKIQKIMRRINPGFKSVMKIKTSLDGINTYLTIQLFGVNNVRYLTPMYKLFNSIIRLYQDPASSGVSVKTINSLCKKKSAAIEDRIFKDDFSANSEEDMEIDGSVPYEEKIIEEPLNIDSYDSDLGSDFGDIMGIGSDEDETEDENSGGSKGGDGSSDSSLVPIAKTGINSDDGSNDRSNSDSSLVPIANTANISDDGSNEGSNEGSNDFELIEDDDSGSQSSLVPLAKDNVDINIDNQTNEEEDGDGDEEEINIPEPIQLTKNKVLLKEKVLVEEKGKNKGIRNIDGLNIKNPNPIEKRLKNFIPELFVKKLDINGKMEVYSRMCPSNKKFQPIVLTQQEKDKMVQEQKGDLNEERDFIKYSTDPNDPDKTYYYTCPQYWCLLTNEVVTETDILKGKCSRDGKKPAKLEDAIIPNTASVVPKDKYVMKLYDNKDGKNYPGFHKHSTKEGMCIPCCYKNWDTEKKMERRNICQGKTDEAKPQGQQVQGQDLQKPDKQTEELKRIINDGDQYIVSAEKYPLGENRLGFLPVSIQKFINDVNSNCQTNQLMPTLKLNQKCLLRLGVENSSNQSFIACIASVMFYGETDKETGKPLLTKYLPKSKNKVPSIDEMKQIILDAINLDTFMKYQNGDLIETFATNQLTTDVGTPVNLDIDVNLDTDVKLDTAVKDAKSVDINKPEYKMTKIYKKGNKDFVRKLVQSYENFQKFMLDNESEIDYLYLWDIVCFSNPKLFEHGLNLIIFEIPEDDPTMNINIICPSNHYSSQFYDVKKKTLFLIKREKYFEPIYLHEKTEKKNKPHKQVFKTFSLEDKFLLPNIKNVIEKTIIPIMENKCGVFPSKSSKVYRFQHAPLLDDLIMQLHNKKYEIKTQVLNFQGKVIGLLVVSPSDKPGFVPCFPSALSTLTIPKCHNNNKKGANKMTDANEDSNCTYDYVYMTDDIWLSYKKTLEFLEEYEEDFELVKPNKKIKHSFLKVTDNGVVVGFLTNTNQFVPIQIDGSSVQTEMTDDIRSIDIYNVGQADANTLLNNSIDTERTDFIKKIKLETNYYNAFRNTIRILLNDYSNNELKKQIYEESKKKNVFYIEHINRIKLLLVKLVGNHVVFAGNKSYDYKNVDENNIHTCIQPKNKCKDYKLVCRVSKKTCALILPKQNLLNQSDNEIIYYEKMSDELIIYNRIKSFIFKPHVYLSFGKVKYNLKDDEMIILQDLLTPDFFENLVPSTKNKYAHYNTFDTAKPSDTFVAYSNKADLNKIIEEKPVDKSIDKSIENEIVEEISENFSGKDKEISRKNIEDIAEEDEIEIELDNNTCKTDISEYIKSLKWRKCFPKEYKEIKYGSSKTCSIKLIIDIVNNYTKKLLTVLDIKKQLVQLYTGLIENAETHRKLIGILKEEGSMLVRSLFDKLNRTIINQNIMSEDYYLVNFDLWLLLNHYKIPSIFISSKTIPETRFNDYEFVCYKTEDINDSYIFISTPGMYSSKEHDYPKYKLVIDENNNMLISLRSLKKGKCLGDIEKSIKKYYTPLNYVENIFEKETTTNYIKKQKGIRKTQYELELVDEELVEEETEEPTEQEKVEEAIVAPVIVKNPNPVTRPRRCPKGTRWSEEEGKCVPKENELAAEPLIATAVAPVVVEPEFEIVDEIPDLEPIENPTELEKQEEKEQEQEEIVIPTRKTKKNKVKIISARQTQKNSPVTRPRRCNKGTRWSEEEMKCVQKTEI